MSTSAVPHRAFNRRHLFRGAALLGITGVGVAGGMRLSRPAYAVDAPEIHDCAAWGARPPAGEMPLHPRPNKILIHHTATDNVEDYSVEHAHALARSIQDMHMDGNGWPDSGQHFTVSRGGHALEGRTRSLELLEGGQEMIQGAHCPDQNDQAIGIENEGTYVDVDVPQELWDSLVTMCAYIAQQYEIAPEEIYGHRDFFDTQCPGEVLYGRLDELKESVADAMG